MTADYAYADHPSCPYHEPSPDAADRQRRARDVAERHFRTASPEFAEWLDGRLSLQDQAALVAGPLSYGSLHNASAVAKRVQREWLEYAATIPHELQSDIAREP